MLAHLRHHLAAVLASASHATLATSGPAGLQAQIVPCASEGLRLLLLVPHTSDQLLNLEAGGAVVVTSAGWQAWGAARVLEPLERPAGVAALAGSDAACYALVEVRPSRVAIARREGWGAAETIDLEDEVL
jgi:predicted Zn-dependent protease